MSYPRGGEKVKSRSRIKKTIILWGAVLLGVFVFFSGSSQAYASVLNDTFNDSDGALLSGHTSESGHTWSKASDWNVGEIVIYNNGSGTHDAYSSTAGDAVLYLSNWTPGSTDYSISAPMRFASEEGPSAGIMLRTSSDGGYGYLAIYNVVASEFQIFKEVNGSLGSPVGSASYAFSNGSPAFSVQVVGISAPVVTVTVNGSAVITYTDNSPASQLQVAGQVGLWFVTNTAGTGTTGLHVSSVTSTDLNSSPLSVGNASLTSAAATTLNLSVVAASGGTSPYAYQWYRSATAAFTSGPSNLLSGATSATLSDTPPSAGPWFYKCVATDSTGATATSTQTAGTLEAPTITNNSVSGSLPTTISILSIGDSITFGAGLSAGQDPVTQMGDVLSSMLGTRSVTPLNQGHSGSQTSDWLPGAGTTYLTSAVSAAQAATPAATVAMITLGANDAAISNHVASTTYISNISSIITYLLGHGFSKVILNYPTYIPAGANSGATDEIGTLLTQQYLAKIDSLINGTTILRGDMTAYPFFQDNQGDVQADQVHPNSTGAKALGAMWATAAAKALGITFTPISKFSAQPNQTSSTTILFLAGWASTGSQNVTLTSDNSSDTLVASTTSGTGNITYTLPVGSSFVPFTISRTTAGTSNITTTNAQGWTNPASLAFVASIPDTTPPVISSISGQSLSTTGATITWTTDKNSASEVAYGTMPPYTSETSFDPTLVTNHSVPVLGLSAGTLYHYAVVSKDSSGNIATSSDQTFTTSSSGGAGGSFSYSGGVSGSFMPITVNVATTTIASLPGCPKGYICTFAPKSQMLTLPSFTRDLAFGSSGADVVNLQRFLNSRGFTVAIYGPGSLGHESAYFGLLTKAALIKFQKANDIIPAVGYFGPVTRAVVRNYSK